LITLGQFLEISAYTEAMSDTQAQRASNFGVISVRPRELREVVDYSEKENVDEFWANARRDARNERERRNARVHGRSAAQKA
jgi:hypothetical protein